ncbi:MAG: hypothetical protein ACI4V5_00735 [Prevotella sp.]
MEKQVVLTTGIYKNVVGKSLNMQKTCPLSKTITNMISKAINSTIGFVINMQLPLCIMSRYYSKVLEREINIRQACSLTEAQVAFLTFIFPADYSIILRVCVGIWVFFALKRCKERLREK